MLALVFGEMCLLALVARCELSADWLDSSEQWNESRQFLQGRLLISPLPPEVFDNCMVDYFLLPPRLQASLQEGHSSFVVFVGTPANMTSVLSILPEPISWAIRCVGSRGQEKSRSNRHRFRGCLRVERSFTKCSKRRRQSVGNSVGKHR